MSGRDCPWLTSEIKSNIRERDFYLRQAKRTGAELNWSTYRRMRNKVTLMIRKSKASHSRITYCAGKNSNEIEHLLNNELQKVADWLDENNLFINLKKKEKLNLFYMDHIRSCPNSQAWRSRSTIKLSMRQSHTSTLV